MARIPKHPYQVEVVVSCPKTADDISKRVVDIMTGSLSAEPGAIPRAEQHLRKNVASMVAAAVAEERSRCLAIVRGERGACVEGDDIDAVVMIYAERRIAEGA